MQERICGYRALLHRPHRTCEIPLHADFPDGCRPGVGEEIPMSFSHSLSAMLLPFELPAEGGIRTPRTQPKITNASKPH